MGMAKGAISSELSTWQRYTRTVGILGMCISLLVACSAGENTSGTAGSGSTRTAGTATVLPSVKVINSTQADYVAAQTATTWTLRTASSVKAGDVLLLDDAAVKVVSVDTSSGQMVLTVTPAEIQDVFSKLNLHLTFNQNDAEFTPDPTSSIPVRFTSSTTGSSTAGSSIAAPITGSVERVLTFPYNAPPISASLSFKFLGDTQLDYDSSSNAGLTGTLEMTGIVQGDVSMSADGAVHMASPELSLGTLRIPVPISIVDSILGALGIRIASIYIPVSVGAEATAGGAFGATVTATGQSTILTTYDATNGFVVTGPTNTSSGSLNGIVPSNIPNTVARYSVKAGPFIHASPQLLILNKVASIGADTKIGLYGNGQLTSILDAPYYCLDLQGMVQGTAFGFFRPITGGRLQANPISRSQDVGPRFVYPDTGCSPAVQFDSASYSVEQTAGSVAITVTRQGDPSAATTVQYATSNGTAVAGRDYTAVSGALTFNPLDTTQTFTVPIFSAPTSQGGTVTLTLSQPSAGTLLGTPSTAVLTITPSKSMQFSLATYSANATLGLTSIVVTRTGDLSEAATVQYATSNGTAVVGQDYTAVSGTLTFAQFDGAQSFDIPIPPTSQGGTVNLTLSQPSTGTILGTPSTAVLTIASGISGTWSGPYSLSYLWTGVGCHDQGILSMTIMQNGTSFTGTYSRTLLERVNGPCTLHGTFTISGQVSGTLTTAENVTTLTGTFRQIGDEDGLLDESWTATVGNASSSMTGQFTNLGYDTVTTSSFTLTKQ